MILKPCIVLDSILDKELVYKVEKSKRGGYRFVGTERYGKANTK